MVIFAVIVISLVGCKPESFNKKYAGTGVWEVGDGIPPSIFCDPNGNDCKENWISTDLAPGVVQYYFSIYDYTPPSQRAISEINLDRKNPMVQAAIFLYYKNHFNPKDYFVNENWAILFPEIKSDNGLVQLINSGSFDLLFVENDESLLFVKDKAKGYTVDNVLFACQTNFKLELPKK